MLHMILEKNRFLGQEVHAYCHDWYLGMRHPANRLIYLNYLKNDQNERPAELIARCEAELRSVLAADFTILAAMFGRLTVCGIPRSKREASYTFGQMGLKRAISAVARSNPMLEDGTDYIVRHTDTKCTHRANWGYGGAGEMPRPGLIRDTCILSPSIYGKAILLVDDIYTPGCGIDEDGIQALFDAGAQSIIFYAVGKARGNGSGFRLCA